VEGVRRPGTRLQERTLCEVYGISRSPLREAFQILVAEKLIDVSVNKGAVVSTPTASFILQNFTLLRSLELLAIRLACRYADGRDLDGIGEAEEAMKACIAANDLRGFFRANNEVHRRIVLAGGNGPLADAHLIASRQIIRVQNLDGPLEHFPGEGVSEHERVIAALRERDEVLAHALLDAHLDTIEDNLRRRLEALVLEPT
jgi:DNA-binding GntR family transcriptional regulator